MNFDRFIKAIVNIKHLPLLGEKAHAKLSPPFRLQLADKYKEKRKTASVAGVMALFYPNKFNETELVFILRNTYKGVHSGQVGFPGGRVEVEDENLMQTALRETQEEIGVLQQHINVVKTMTPLYIPPSNFMVYPFIGVLKYTPRFIKQESEVAAVLKVKLTDILDEHALITTKVNTSYKVKVSVPAFQLNGHKVWGATAMILSEIKELLKQVL